MMTEDEFLQILVATSFLKIMQSLILKLVQ